MIECLCLVQTGHTADQKQAELSALVNGFTQRSFGEEAQISWIPAHAGIALDETGSMMVETPASWVMEGGEVMPEPGEEAEWLARHGVQP